MPNIVIIGGGPAGLSAAIYAVRAGMQATVLYKDGGALAKTDKIENYFGFIEPVSGAELLERGQKQAERLGAVLRQTEVTGIEYAAQGFTVKTADGVFDADAVILATDNHLCFMASTGDITDEENRTLEFIDIDLNKNKMTTVFSDKGGFPYDTVTGADNLVIITKVLDNGTSLELYDTETQKFKQLKYLEFDDKNCVGKTIRKVSIDKSTKTISLLVLDCISQNEASLKIETYDYDMNFLKSYDISNISDDSNELIQGVQVFDFKNNYLFYQNFSITRCIGYIDSDKLKKSDISEDVDDTFSIVSASEDDSDTNLLYKRAESSSENNYIYLFDTTNKTMKKTKFNIEEKGYTIGGISRIGKDNLMIMMSPDNADKKSDLNSRIYFTKLSDLNFQ